MSLYRTKASTGLLWFLSISIALVSARLLVPSIISVQDHIADHYNDRALVLLGHIGFAVLALAIMPAQFQAGLRKTRPRLHRVLGRVYVISCTIGGVCGLWLALTTQSGLVAASGFGMLAVLWVYATLQGVFDARARAFGSHRQWMIRSGAMTFAAVTLRLYIGIGVASGNALEDFYPLVAWACWVPNLIIAEWWLLGDTARKRAVS